VSRQAATDLAGIVGDEGDRIKKLGLPQALAPYWLATDPTASWHAGDKQARAVYTKWVLPRSRAHSSGHAPLLLHEGKAVRAFS
jgi:hypothetical protein